MTSTSKQLTFCAGLTLLFILLKLIKFIHWSWLWILSPVWIPIAFGIIVAIIYFTLLKNITEDGKEKRKWKKRLDEIVEEANKLEQKSK